MKAVTFLYDSLAHSLNKQEQLFVNVAAAKSCEGCIFPFHFVLQRKSVFGLG